MAMRPDLRPLLKTSNPLIKRTTLELIIFLISKISHFFGNCIKSKRPFKAKGRKKPPVKPGTFDKLTEFFKIHNVKFYNMMNRTFGWPT